MRLWSLPVLGLGALRRTHVGTVPYRIRWSWVGTLSGRVEASLRPLTAKVPPPRQLRAAQGARNVLLGRGRSQRKFSAAPKITRRETRNVLV